jgi:hypothetical protein
MDCSAVALVLFGGLAGFVGAVGRDMKMSRIRNAWLVLTGGEPELTIREVEVEGPPSNVERVTLYRHSCARGIYTGLSEGWYDRIKIYHPNCEAAFAAMPEKDRELLTVEAVEAYRVGNQYFKASGLLSVAKPKRAKGAK